MKEIVKSAVLTLLVATSIVLTTMLWFNTSPTNSPQDPYVEPPPISETEPIVELLAPMRIAIHPGGDRHVIISSPSPDYAYLWRVFVDTLQGKSGLIKPASPEDWDVAVLQGPSLEVDFRADLPYRDWGRIFDFATNILPEEIDISSVLYQGGKANRLLLLDKGREKFFEIKMDAGGMLDSRITSAAGSHMHYRKLDPVPLWLPRHAPERDYESQLRRVIEAVKAGRPVPEDLVQERVTEDKIGYRIIKPIYVPIQTPAMWTIKVHAEEIDIKEFTHALFAQPDMLRRIVERGNAIIYTDGQGWLRLYENGALEYSLSVEREQKEVSLYRALITAREYVSRLGGWPISYLRDWSYETEGKELISLEFDGIFLGYPITGKNPAVQVTVDDSGLRSFFRNVQVPLSFAVEGSVIRPEEAIWALAQQENAPSPEASLRDVYLSYYIVPASGNQETYLQPVWTIVFANGLEVYVNAFSAEVIDFKPKRGAVNGLG